MRLDWIFSFWYLKSDINKARELWCKSVVPNLLGLKSRRHVLCTFLVPCDIKTVINIPIWQLFWSRLDLLQVLVPGCVPVVGNLWSICFAQWNNFELTWSRYSYPRFLKMWAAVWTRGTSPCWISNHSNWIFTTSVRAWVSAAEPDLG